MIGVKKQLPPNAQRRENDGWHIIIFQILEVKSYQGMKSFHFK